MTIHCLVMLLVVGVASKGSTGCGCGFNKDVSAEVLDAGVASTSCCGGCGLEALAIGVASTTCCGGCGWEVPVMGVASVTSCG